MPDKMVTLLNQFYGEVVLGCLESVEWNGGMDWDKIFVLACSLKRYIWIRLIGILHNKSCQHDAWNS